MTELFMGAFLKASLDISVQNIWKHKVKVNAHNIGMKENQFFISTKILIDPVRGTHTYMYLNRKFSTNEDLYVCSLYIFACHGFQFMRCTVIYVKFIPKFNINFTSCTFVKADENLDTNITE